MKSPGSVMSVPMAQLVPNLTAASLAAIGGLHVAWGLGSPFPVTDRHALADAVIGSHEVPPPVACFAVAGALGAAAALVVGRPTSMPRLRRTGVTGVIAVLATRGALGLRGRTALLSPGSDSPRFRRLDRSVYSPLCLALAAGAVTALR